MKLNELTELTSYGKSTGETTYVHSLKTMAWMNILYDNYLTPELKKEIPLNLLLICAGLHDIGKISPNFLKKYFSHIIDDIPAKINKICPHNLISKKIIAGMDFKSVELKSFIQKVVASHHGSLDSVAFTDENGASRMISAEDTGEKNENMQKIRKNFFDIICNQLSVDFDSLANINCIKGKNKEFYGTYIAGMLINADWLASTETFLQDVDFETITSFGELKSFAYRDFDKIKACEGSVKRGLLVSQMFPTIPNFTLRPLQEEFVDFVMEKGIYCLEAGMGDGKTEASSVACYKLLTRGLGRGVIVGMPTQATANKIYERFNAFLTQITKDSVKAKLIHGNAEHYTDEYDWFSKNKTALLKRFCVCTIDQTLMSILNYKHFPLRLFALSGKIIIFDEIHCYDYYMQTIIKYLLPYLEKMGCSVVFLSATLSKEQKEVFFGKQNYSNAYPLASKISYSTKVFEQKALTNSRNQKFKPLFFKKNDACDKILDLAKRGYNVGVIMNTVGATQKIFRNLKNKGVLCGLLHSKFIKSKRDAVEACWLSKLSRGGERPTGSILVATQVIEQSVDLDFDVLFTDIAPIDAIFQRTGRLWRHAENIRPKDCVEPRCYILLPKYSEEMEKNPDKNFLKTLKNEWENSHYVYWAIDLINAYFYLGKKEGDYIKTPEDIRGAIETCYNQNIDPKLINLLDSKIFSRISDESEAKKGITSIFSEKSNDKNINYGRTRLMTIDYTKTCLIKDFVVNHDFVTLTFLNGETVKLNNLINLTERDRNKVCWENNNKITKILENSVLINKEFLLDKSSDDYPEISNFLGDGFIVKVVNKKIHFLSGERVVNKSQKVVLEYDFEEGLQKKNL